MLQDQALMLQKRVMRSNGVNPCCILDDKYDLIAEGGDNLGMTSLFQE